MKKQLYFPLLITLLASLILGVLPFGQPSTVYAAPDIETLRPNAAGDYQEWETLVDTTSHWEALSDSINTTYIQTANTTIPIDIQNLADPTFYAGAKINSVTYYIVATATGSGGDEKIDIFEKLGASERTTTQTITRDTWNEYSVIQTTAPDGASWTYQKVIDLQAGVQVKSLAKGETLSVSEVWIVVDYTPPNISNTPDNYPFGVVSESSTPATGLTHFEVTNNSGYAVNITIGGTDMIGGVTWTLDNDGIPGPDTYGLKAGLVGGSYNVTVMKNGPYNTLISNLADSSSQQWGLQFLAPTSFSDGGSKSGTVTLTATQP